MENLRENMKRIMAKKNVGTLYEEMMAEVYKDPDVVAFLKENQGKLTPAEIEKSAAKLYEFVQEKKKYRNASSNQLAPGYKPQLILSHHFIDVSYLPTEELLKAQKNQAILNRVSTLLMPKYIKNANFEEFDLTPQREEALDAALAFVEEYRQNPKKFHQGLYFSGSFGVGKSYLLGAIAHELAVHGFETLLVHFPSFVGEMKQAISQGNVSEKLNHIKKVPILMLDDLGADNLSSWIRDEVLGVILQYRLQEELPLFVSSNISLKDLEEQYLTTNQKGEAEPLKAKRIMERFHFLTKEVVMVGDNRRNP